MQYLQSTEIASQDDTVDTSIDEINIEMMNVKLRKNVTGLVNLGNTCYLNCMIQCLYSCRKYRS